MKITISMAPYPPRLESKCMYLYTWILFQFLKASQFILRMGFRLSNLYALTMDRNQFRGTIPETFGNLQNIQYLSFGDNAFTGSLPDSFAQLTNLGMSKLQNRIISIYRCESSSSSVVHLFTVVRLFIRCSNPNKRYLVTVM